jgi:hypothetical protein
MSRISIIVHHDSATEKIVTHADNANDIEMLDYAVKTFGPAHRIKRVHLCSENSVHVNEAPLVTWLKTVKRLTK